LSIRLSRNLHAVGLPGCYLTMEFSMTEGENNRSSNITIFNGCRDCNLDCMHVSEMLCDVIFSVSPRINHGGTKRRRMNSSKGYSVEPKSRKIALKSYNLFILCKYGQRYIERAFTCSRKRKPNSNNDVSIFKFRRITLSRYEKDWS